MTIDYLKFIEDKSQLKEGSGFEPVFMPEVLKDFQVALSSWAIGHGRGSIFADCGMGKTPMQLVYAENVVRKTGRPVLIMAPLAVSAQTAREAEKFGIEVNRADKNGVRPGINITNYEKLHMFDSDDFAGAVCDESSILKSFGGKRRAEITTFMRKMKYRLLCTATAAPNDYHELGTSSEALGYMGYMDMLSRFFKNDRNTADSRGGMFCGKKMEWRFKGHAEDHFWRWVCSWARACRKPSDLGFDDLEFTLPPLTEEEHLVDIEKPREGCLFYLPSKDLIEQREDLRHTMRDRCEKAADLVDHKDQSIIWCHLNDEGNLLQKLIPGSVQVSGSDKDQSKEDKFLGFASGSIRTLITKPKIGGLGLNFQNCSHIVFFPSHSFEQYYQAVRRCWRFGQNHPVKVDVVTTVGQQRVLENLQRKAHSANRMFDRLVLHMRNQLDINSSDSFLEKECFPQWL